MASFEEILKKPGSEIKPPAAFPVGTYHCLVDGPLEPGAAQKGTRYFRAKFKILSPYKDVDAAQAAEAQVVGKIITNDYYFPTDGSDPWRLVEFLHDDLDIEDSKPLDEMISEAPGKQVLVVLRHELSPDGKRVFHRVASTAHV